MVIRARLKSVGIAFRRIPDARDWPRLLTLYLIFVVVALGVGFGTGFLTLTPARGNAILIAALPFLLFLKPSLLEETIFRAALIPHPREASPRPKRWALATLSLLLFVGMHPVNGLLFRHNVVDLFTHPVFLSLVFALGLACTAAYLMSGSLWPSVLMHWLSVTVWIEFLGGAAWLRLVSP